MKKGQLDLENRTVWIPDSKTPNGVAEVRSRTSRLMRFATSLRSQGQALPFP